MFGFVLSINSERSQVMLKVSSDGHEPQSIGRLKNKISLLQTCEIMNGMMKIRSSDQLSNQVYISSISHIKTGSIKPESRPR